MSTPDVVKNFFGVYLLKSLNPKYKGRTYIGFTVNPNRRIRQHNRGQQFGGAWRTSKRGPWDMILTVHGFSSDTAALRFEWAWQHPKRSRRLKGMIGCKKSAESSLDYNIRIMFTMLSIPPWNRLPLTVRWISAEAVVDAPPNLSPPAHMPVVYGTVVSKKHKSISEGIAVSGNSYICNICSSLIQEEDLLVCLRPECKGNWHIFCLAKRFLEEEREFSVKRPTQEDSRGQHLVPVEGSCSECKSSMLWGDLIRRKCGIDLDKKKRMSESSFSDTA